MQTSKVAALLLLVAIPAMVCLGQSSTTLLRGTVTDPKHAVMPGAEVTISNPDTGFSRTVKSDNDGSYQFLQIPPGTYVLQVSASGFAKIKQSHVELLVNTPNTINFSLKIATAETTIEVRGEAAPVNTQDATLGNPFGQTQIQSLPFEGRDPVGILSLQPGVVFTGNSTSINPDFDSRSGAVNGARSDQTNVTLDGIDDNDQTKGYAFKGALRSTLDSLQEFRVTTSNANADMGRSSGAQVALLTKSGTNKFHGSLYEYHRPTFTTANDWFNKKAQLEAGLPNVPGKVVRNTFGGTFGGPIKKDRIYFFAAYEGNRLRESFQVTRVVPSADLRNGIVHYLTCTTAPDCTGQPLTVVTLTPGQLASMDPNCTGNGTCPLGPGPNPAVEAMLQTYPMPNTDAVGDGLNYRGFTFAAPAPANLHTFIVKLDFNLTQSGNHRAFVRGGMQNDHQTLTNDPNTLTGNGGPQFPGQPARLLATDNSKGIIAAYTATLSNTLINSFRFGYVRQGTGENGLSSQHFIHLRGLDDPQGFSRTTSVIVPVHNLNDDVTWIRGKHTLQFGGNFRLIRDARVTNANSFTTLTTNVSWLDNAAIANTGSSLDPAAFGFPAVASSFSSSYDSPVMALVGAVSEVDAQYNRDKTAAVLPEGTLVARHFKAFELEGYGQDSWRVTRHFMVTLGLRYTLLQPPYESNGVQVTPSVSLNDFFNKRAAAMKAGKTYDPLVSFDLSGQANGRKPYWAWDYKDVAPRVAFAWSPHWEHGWLHALFGGEDKSSIRAGYGIYYDHFGEGIVNTFDRFGSFGLSTTITNPAATQDIDCGFRFVNPLTAPAVGASFCGQVLNNPAPAGTFPVTPPAGLFAITWGLDDKLKTPYAHVMDFSITRELPGHLVLQASYVGRLGRRLLQEQDLAMPLDIVDPASNVDYFTAATQLARMAEAGTLESNVVPIPYWQNLFPTAAGPGGISGCAPGAPGSPTATQNMYDLYTCFLHNETTALFVADLLCFPGCATVNGVTGPFQYFDSQWSSLYAWRSIGTSSYHAFQLSLRRGYSHGLQFDLNYTLSKSMDIGSNAERINEFEGFGLGSQIINSWSPRQLKAVSDYDTRHQINSNWIYELPVGRGRTWGAKMNRTADALLGGWKLAGLFRWSSGYPISVGSGLGFWPTNWQLTSNPIQTGPLPPAGTFLLGPSANPNLFKNPAAALALFRFAHPGESGQRNILRGPGAFGVDLGLAKTWKIGESQSVKFSWETFNVTNSVRFDVATASLSLSNSSSFGNYSSTLTKPRAMQFALRFSF